MAIVIANGIVTGSAIAFAVAIANAIDLLVPSFLAAEDTMMQDRAAYAMQELLRFCGFTSDLTID
eukprot:Awhi_evm1s12091